MFKYNSSKQKGFPVNFKYLIIISGLTVATAYTCENEQPKSISITSVATNECTQLIPLTSFSTLVPYKNHKKNIKMFTLEKLLTSNKYNHNLAVYIEIKPFYSKTKPRLEWGNGVAAATMLSAINKKQCFYYPEDDKIYRDMREERCHVPYILITDDSSPSVLIHG